MAQRSDTRSESERPPNADVRTNGETRTNGEQKTNGDAKGELAPGVLGPNATALPWRSYKEQVASIAQKIVEAQRPIRVLQALRWEPAIEEAFRRGRFRELPKVGPDDYAKVDLGFETRAKMDEFDSIAHATEIELGTKDPI